MSGNDKQSDGEQQQQYERESDQQYERDRRNQQYGQGERDPGYGREPPTARGEQPSVPALDDEEVLIDARPAWSAYMWYFVAAALVLLGGVGSGGNAAIGGLLLAGIIVGYVYYLRQKVRYVVTNQRMMILRGITSKSTNEAWMVDIVGLSTGASLLERLLGHGHITVSRQIGATGIGPFGGMTFGGIHNHEDIAQIVRERQQEEKM
jgi:hypothetical protein